MHRKKLVKDKGEEQEFIKGFSQNKVVHELRILQKKNQKKNQKVIHLFIPRQYSYIL